MEEEVQAKRYEGNVVRRVGHFTRQLPSDQQRDGVSLHAAKEEPDGW